MDHQVEHHAHLCATRIERSQAVGSNKLWLSDRIFKVAHHRVVMLDMTNLHDTPRSLRRRENIFGLFKADAQRLLNQQMAAAVKQRHCHITVMIGRHYDAYRIAGFGQCFERVKASAIVCCAHFGSTCVVGLDDTHQLTLLECSIDTSMVLAERTGAYDTTANF